MTDLHITMLEALLHDALPAVELAEERFRDSPDEWQPPWVYMNKDELWSDRMWENQLTLGVRIRQQLGLPPA